jgi:hypothetical protein
VLAGPPRGLSDQSFDSGLAERARRALECPWHEGFSISCEPYARWLDALESGEPDRSLVALLGDPDLHVRYLGAAGLARRGVAYRRDAGLRAEILERAAREREPTVAARLGAVTARLEATREEDRDRLLALAREHPVPGFRAALWGDALHYQGDAWFDPTRETSAKDADPAVRLAALAAFFVGGSSRPAEVCALWRAHLASGDPALAERTAYWISFWGRCQADFDALLEEQERRAQEGRMSWAYLSSLEYLALEERAAPAQKERALAVARSVVENRKNGWAARNRALEWLHGQDPKSREFVSRFAQDGELQVRDKAHELLKR